MLIHLIDTNKQRMLAQPINIGQLLQIQKYNPPKVQELLDKMDGLFVKTAGDKGSIVYFHPNVPYVFKLTRTGKLPQLKEEYEKLESLHKRGLPVPRPIAFIKVDDQTHWDKLNILKKDSFARYIMVMENVGNPLHILFAGTNKNDDCRNINIWIQSLKDAITALSKAGYEQTDWSNLGNFVINKDTNEVYLIDVESMVEKDDTNTTQDLVKAAMDKMGWQIEHYCKNITEPAPKSAPKSAPNPAPKPAPNPAPKPAPKPVPKPTPKPE